MQKLMFFILGLLFSTVILASQQNGVDKMELISSAFHNGESIPKIYTCDGKDISPPLQWQHAPHDTKSFVLILHDPDAPKGDWVHWILFNLPAGTAQLPENIQTLPIGTKEGKNSWGTEGYRGPCPPNKMHRYFFELYALDTQLSLDAGVTKKTIEKAMKNHILINTQLIGQYQRQP